MSEKLTALTATTTLDETDLVYVVTDVGGTPISKKITKANLQAEVGGSPIVSDTGTNITFTADTLWNEATYLTSGNLTLDLTGAVKGVIGIVYCNGYIPTISGEDVFIVSGSPIDGTKLNVLSFFYDGTKIYLAIGKVATLSVSTLTLTPLDESIQSDWTSVVGATNYVLERSLDNFATAGTEVYSGALLTYTDTGLTNGVTYYYRVKAQATGQIDSAWSTVQSEVPAVVSFWSSRVPSLGYSMWQKLNPSATYAFQVDTVSTGGGTTTDIGFDGDLVDIAALDALGDNLYVSKIYNQGSVATMDLTIGSLGNLMAVREGGVTTLKDSVFAGYTTGNVNYTAPSSWAGFATNNPSTAFTVAANDTTSSITVTSYTASNTLGYSTWMDGTTNKWTGKINSSGTDALTLLSAQRADTDRRILGLVKTATTLSSYDNDQDGTQDSVYSPSQLNNQFFLLSANGGSVPFEGYWNDYIVYPTDVGDTERNLIRDHLNTTYTIY